MNKIKELLKQLVKKVKEFVSKLNGLFDKENPEHPAKSNYYYKVSFVSEDNEHPVEKDHVFESPVKTDHDYEKCDCDELTEERTDLFDLKVVDNLTSYDKTYKPLKKQKKKAKKKSSDKKKLKKSTKKNK